ncbi:MAG: nicotinate phosphoribosyltransferase [Alphaproteobacteria bacterium]|jgi:nicotinate phosphoribosyltransferase|nr:nicotinate phosphoribosyltransferase [Alphaproteobacteria bacterium]MBT4966764.1 nicotinate phosphoribosyltransferase [Alphaproteobacteria bacterium]MBT5160921.1 nicotinate phosphoribosyltransferase [Alphaproteobacteria bacterium]MBT5917833.1 nicotinate phosphoribosyltransferase [Alphaproteobacteria bacterium]MBT6386417.1 nicotinate phosphoribosyltransferase [Alphaproteobacteria bacterium]
MTADVKANAQADGDVSAYTDKYFSRTRETVARHGDKTVTYAVFMRRPVRFATRIAVDWIKSMAAKRGIEVDIEERFGEGEEAGGGEPLLYITGSFVDLVDLETLYLQKIGAACVAAMNAYDMCTAMPRSGFMAFDSRHCAGQEMANLMAYAASVGSDAARRDTDAIGFIGNATDATAHWFGNETGLGTMPHALIGYAGSTLRAAEMFHDTYPEVPLVVLVDFFGQEITDALEVCKRFPELAADGQLSIRLDTHGGRFVEGLNPQSSYAVMERHAPEGIREYRSENELKWLVGTGVSAAAVFHLREVLDNAGFDKVKIVVSSGFNASKCRIMGSVSAPVDVVGTGSFLPENWAETYATADIISYDGAQTVKIGREFLLKK